MHTTIDTTLAHIADEAAKLFAKRKRTGGEPVSQDYQMAARNAVYYGMSGYTIHVGHEALGFCDHETISQNPGQVTRNDWHVLAHSLADTLDAHGDVHSSQAARAYAERDFSVFTLG